MHHWYNWIPVVLIIAALLWFLARPASKAHDQPAQRRDQPTPAAKRARRRKPK